MDILVFSPTALRQAGKTYPCVIGRGGFTQSKQEGDGATPVGCFPMRSLRYRSDKISAPQCRLPTRPIGHADGWCDDPADPAYNRPVSLPFAASHERLWRDDGLYDLVVELGYNDNPPKPGAGSAIFLHVMRPDGGPTEGCVALRRDDLLEILKRVGPESQLIIQPDPPMRA